MYWDEPIFVSDAFSIKPNIEVLNTRYTYHFLLQNQGKIYNLKKGSGVPHVYPKDLALLTIPILPLETQQKIVKILDKFTELEATLEAELALRKRQYQYYRDFLLDFDNQIWGGIADGYKGRLKDVVWKTLGEVCHNISSGKNKKRDINGIYPIYGSTGIIGKTNEKVYGKQHILVARVGANAGFVHIGEGEYDVSDNTLIIDNKDNILFGYLFYVLKNMKLNQFARGAGQPLLTAGQLKSLKIPIPPLPEQEKIVAILDKFDTLTHSISEGLPHEIALRRKQYEYYREQLLAFPAAA